MLCEKELSDICNDVKIKELILPKLELYICQKLGNCQYKKQFGLKRIVCLKAYKKEKKINESKDPFLS